MIFLFVSSFTLFFVLVTCSIIDDLLHGEKDIPIKSLHHPQLSPIEWEHVMNLVLDLVDQEFLLHTNSSSRMNLWDIYSKRMPLPFPGSSIFIGRLKENTHPPICINRYFVKSGQYLRSNHKICSIMYPEHLCNLEQPKTWSFYK